MCLYTSWLVWRFRTHIYLFETYDDYTDGYDDGTEVTHIPPWHAFFISLLSLLAMAYLSNILECSLESLHGISQRYLVVFGIPILLRLEKHLRAVSFALGDRMGSSLAQSLGFTVTITLFAGPLMILLGWALGQPMTLAFNTFETSVYLLSAWIIGLVASDGKSNYLNGGILLAV